MFTGIITDITTITNSESVADGMKLTFARPASWHDLRLGESVATNGICLTVDGLRATEYDCVLMPETLSQTSFGQKLPERVNLERALQLNDRLSGHFVQGHVDGLGKVTSIDKVDGYLLIIQFDSVNRELVVLKGSITIDGVALTITTVTDHTFEVALIPHTVEHTTLDLLKVGDQVNLEFDMLGKYVIQSLKANR